MSKPQFAILRFAKYKGPEISNIEAHNERTKEKYASNAALLHLLVDPLVIRHAVDRPILTLGKEPFCNYIRRQLLSFVPAKQRILGALQCSRYGISPASAGRGNLCIA